MPPRHQLILALAIPVTLTMVFGLGWLLAQPVPTVPISPAPAQFDAARAQHDVEQWGAQFPVRIVGTRENAQARAWITARFAELGLSTGSLPFTVTVASQARACEQVWAVMPGASDEIVLVTAHVDTPEYGNRDNAAGLAVLLELARIFAEAHPLRTLVFLISDAREYGQAWGTKNLIERDLTGLEDPSGLRVSNVIAALSLEAMNGQDWSQVQIDSAGYRVGYAPLWLRQIGVESIRAAGGQAQDPDGVAEFLARAFPFAMTDHGFFLRSGIPAIGFSGAPGEARPESLETFGRAAEVWVRSVAALHPAPPPNPGEWRLSADSYLPAIGSVFLPLLIFAPLFLATALAAWAQCPRWRDLLLELTALIAIGVVIVDGFAAAFILVALGLLPRYEWFPAAPFDPFLLEPMDWAALVIIVTMGAFAWYTFVPPNSWGRLTDRLDVPHRRVTLLIVFSILVLAAWVLNGFTAALLLAPAAYLWLWIAPRPLSAGKALNVMLALGGILPLVGVFIALGTTPGLGLFWWFLTLAATYGLIPLPVTTAFIVGVALFARFLRYGWR